MKSCRCIPSFFLSALLGLLLLLKAGAQNLTGDVWAKPLAPLGVSGIVDMTAKGSEVWAVGVDGVFKSTNLTTWSKVTTEGLTDTLFCIRWTGTRFVASGFGCWTSTDGVRWTRRGAFGPRVAMGMAVRGDKVVAGGVLGAIHHSEDGGLTWGRVDLGDGLFFSSIAATSTHFVAVGMDGVIFNSTDGVTWTQRNSTTSEALWDITLAGSRLVAVGDELTVATSTDNGNTWASYQAAANTGVAFNAVAGDASYTILLAKGTVARATNPAVPSSLGVLQQPTIQSEMTCAVRVSGVGWACGGRGSAIMTSSNSDANTWTLRHPVSAYAYFSAVRTSSHFLAAGYPADNVMRSSDGVTWAATGTGIPNTEGVTSMAWSGTRLVAGTGSGKIYSTSAAGGTGFALRNSGTTQRLNGSCWTGSQFLITGNGGVILSSTDGTTWVARTSGTTGNLYGVASSGTVHVACGGVAGPFSLTGVILTSTNGIAWTQVLSQSDTIVAAVAWNGSYFAAVGLDGLVLTSPDGQNWTPRTVNPDTDGNAFDKNLAAIVWAGTNWIAATEEGGVVLSADGVEWKEQEVAGGQPLNALTYGLSKAVAVGDAGQVLTSSAAAPRAPFFLIQPISQTFAEGEAGVLSALPVGTPDLSVQWRKDGQPLPGGVLTSVGVPNASAGDSGNYDLVVTGPGGSVTSAVAVVRVSARPAITEHPVSQQATEGGAVNFTAAAVGAGPITYQWFKTSTGALSGRTSATLSLTALTVASSGEYYVEITNEYGTSTSTIAQLTVTMSLENALDLPAGVAVSSGGSYPWTGLPADVAELRPGSIAGGEAWMEITVTDKPGVMFDWLASGTSYADRLEVLVDGVAIFGVDGPQALRTRAVPTGAGAHTVRWRYTEDATQDFSGLPFVRLDHVTLLSASSPPVIGDDPASVLANEGEAISLKVIAAGGGTLSYQWRKAGVAIPGQTAAEYIIPSAIAAAAGLYSVTVSNSAGSVLSADAAVTVRPSLATALDLPPGITVQTGGGADWLGGTEFHHDGVDAAATGTIPHSSFTWMHFNVTGMTTVSFWWNVSSESCCDHLRFYAGGTYVDGISGTSGEWRQVTRTLDPTIVTTLSWEYTKDGSVANGSDRGWVDQIVLTPLTAVTDFPLWAAPLPAARRNPADRNGPLQIENTLAYSLGLNPLTATPAQLPVLQRSGSQWTYTYTRTRRTTGTSYRVEWSPDPAAAAWSVAGVVHEKTATGTETETWRATLTPPPGATRLFLRLRVALDGSGG